MRGGVKVPSHSSLEPLVKRLLIFLILLSLQGALPAVAALRSQTNKSINAISAAWSVQAVGQGLSPTNTEYTINWGVNSGTAYSFFTFRNTGQLTVTGFTSTITQTSTQSNGKVGETYFDLCQNGTWNSTTNTCSGTIVNVGKASDLTLSFTNLSLTSASELNMRARTAPNVQNRYTTTLSVSVTRSQVRSGITINS